MIMSVVFWNNFLRNMDEGIEVYLYDWVNMLDALIFVC